jgi:hypothetical protein
MLLDSVITLYHFNDVQSIIVRSTSNANILNAVRAITPKEIPFLFELFWLRTLPSFIILGKKYKFSINKKIPLIEQFLASGFILLAEEKSRELVLGGIGQFWKLWGGYFPRISDTQEFLSFNQSNYVKAAINFYVHQNHGGDYFRVSTETRFYVPDQITLKKFARYWLLIHSFSGFSRRMWLRAIKRRITAVTNGRL